MAPRSRWDGQTLTLYQRYYTTSAEEIAEKIANATR